MAVICLVIAGIIVAFGSHSGEDLGDESVTAITEAVKRSALQCYVVEGVYPPDLAYLEENYGLQINKQDYYVTYNAFASNLPPDIIVTAK